MKYEFTAIVVSAEDAAAIKIPEGVCPVHFGFNRDTESEKLQLCVELLDEAQEKEKV